MFSAGFVIDCIIASSCILRLASASGSSLPGVNMALEACIDEESTAKMYECFKCRETIGPNNLPELFLCLCPKTGHGRHAFHRKCMSELIVQKRAEKSENACSAYTSSWEEMYKKSRREALKEFILQPIEEGNELAELRKRASEGTLEESKEIGLETAGHFRVLEEVYSQLSRACVYFPRDFTSPKDPEMEEVFREFGEKVIRKMPIEEAARILAKAPKFIYAYCAPNFIFDPMFYAQLSYKQIVDSGRHLFLLGAKERNFRVIFIYLIDSYIYHNLSTLANNAVECLVDLTASLKLEKAQYWLLLTLIDYNRINLSLRCREKLVIPILRNKEISTAEKLFILQCIGYFTEFTDEMREGAIDYWAQSRKDQNDAGKLFLNILSFRTVKPEGDSRTEILRGLKGILEKQSENKGNMIKKLKLTWCHYMVRSSLNGSSLYNMYKAIMRIEHALTLPRIILSVSSTDLKMRRDLVLISDQLKKRSYVDGILIGTIYLHSGITFEVALRLLFDFVVLANRRMYRWQIILKSEVFFRKDLQDERIYTLHIILKFEAFFRNDLQDRVNARLLFGRLKKHGLYTLMPLFRRYFRDKTEAEYKDCIAKNMGEIIGGLPGLRLTYMHVRIILCELCNTNDENVFEALCKHFSGYLKIFLELHGRCFSALHLMKQIFAKNTFSTHIPDEEIEKIPSVLLEEHVDAIKFKELMEIFFSEVKDAGTQGKMFRRLRDLKALGQLDSETKARLEELFPEEVLCN